MVWFFQLCYPKWLDEALLAAVSWPHQNPLKFQSILSLSVTYLGALKQEKL